MNNRTENATYTRNDIVFALAMLVCGFLYWNLIRLPGLGAGVTLFAVVFCLSTVIYLKSGEVQLTKTSLLCFVVIVLSALVFLLFDNSLIKGLNFIFLTAAAIYWISLSTGRTLEKRISAYILGDFFHQVLVIPFGNFACCFGALKSLIAGNKKGKSLLAGAVGILVILPVLAAVINLLIKADAAFAGVIADLHVTVSIDIILQIILGIPVACYLYGLVYGDRYGRNTGHVTVESVDKMAAACRFAPGVAVYSALTALNLVFIVYFLSQLTYLFSAFNNRLPELMTYAEYARRGFFELCTVAGINLAVITAAHLIVKREKVRVLQAETTALCLFTLMLIITAVSKMVMYINTYGLTQLRVYTTWFMLVLFFFFAVTAVRQFKRFNAARVMLLGFVIFFLTLSYGNIDGRIAAYNIDRYKNGTLERLDVEAFDYLSAAAVPYIYNFYQETTDQGLKAELKAAILKKTGNGAVASSNITFRDFNFQSHTAENIRSML
ncbi:MAG: DUF4173 domain-containing protein [Peptococcaceae bacterium]|nr:DUF4173 domain-containing protein [Peptococcaceae bacterium]